MIDCKSVTEVQKALVCQSTRCFFFCKLTHSGTERAVGPEVTLSDDIPNFFFKVYCLTLFNNETEGSIKVKSVCLKFSSYVCAQKVTVSQLTKYCHTFLCTVQLTYWNQWIPRSGRPVRPNYSSTPKRNTILKLILNLKYYRLLNVGKKKTFSFSNVVATKQSEMPRLLHCWTAVVLAAGLVRLH